MTAFNMNKCFRITLVFMVLCLTDRVYATEIQTIKIAYITQEQKVPAALSNLDAFIQQKGRLGTELAIVDNNTTGRFTQQHFVLQTIIAAVSADIVQVFEQQVAADTAFVVSNLPTEQLKQIARLESAKGKTMKLIDAAKKQNGILTVLVHQKTFSPLCPRYYEWHKWFLELIKEDDTCWKASFNDIVKWYRSWG